MAAPLSTSSPSTRSLWLETCGDDLTPRPPLRDDRAVDVAIVGAGFTGLWTAHHLLRLDPSLRVLVVEREVAGWGASGRNGGWCSALFPVPWPQLVARHGAEAADALRRRLETTVDEVGAWCREHDVDAGFVKGGTLTLARSAAQLTRLRDGADGADGEQWLDAADARRRLDATGVLGAGFTPHCASLHPGRLVRSLARVVEAQGATVAEQTAVRRIDPHRVVTDHGTVTADVVVRATEGYTADLHSGARPTAHRLLAPVWSLVVATAPVPERAWRRIGWAGRETVTDGRHLIVYAQRTADDRIVLGGRGAPYRLGSRTDGLAGHARTHDALVASLHDLLPATRGVAITHRWGGVLGVPRDFMPSVGLDRDRGLAWAGGYVGDGVACAALAGRTLADLVLDQDTAEARLLWVGHRWRRWEPEPLRWAGIRGVNAVMASADRVEARTGRPARRAALLSRLTGG